MCFRSAVSLPHEVVHNLLHHQSSIRRPRTPRTPATIASMLNLASKAVLGRKVKSPHRSRGKRGKKEKVKKEDQEAPTEGEDSSEEFAVEVSLDMHQLTRAAAPTCDSDELPTSENDTVSKQEFTAGQIAYYRDDGKVIKVQVQYYGEYLDRYAIILPDGKQLDNVEPSKLAKLASLTSKELSRLMKERKRSRHKKKETDDDTPQLMDKPSTSTEENTTSTDETNKKEGDAELNLTETASEQTPANDSNRAGTTEDSAPGTTAKSEVIQEVKMVQAKTESGGTKFVPMYRAGMKVQYTNASGVVKAEILDAHFDDLMEPYYSIRMADGKEKQTDNAHLQLEAEESVQDEDKGEKDEKGGQSKSEDIQQQEHEGVAGQDSQDVSRGRTKRKMERRPSLRESLQRMVEAQLKVADTASTERSATNISCNASAEHSNAASSKKKDSHTAFGLGDEVLYKNSKGEQSRAVVVRLLRDKKNRPYYLVRLPEGKKKQVYGHRLKHLNAEEDGGNNNQEVTRSRSRPRDAGRDDKKSRGRSSSANKLRHNTSTNSSSKDLPRSDSMDSRKSHISGVSHFSRSASLDSRQTTASTSSRKSAASRERCGENITRRVPRDPSVASGSSYDRRNSSGKSLHRDRSHSSAHVATGKEKGGSRRHRDKDRSHSSRARSEESRPLSSSKNEHKTSSRGRSSRPTTPSVNRHTGDPPEGGDDQSKTRSISKLRSFRKSFAAMKKQGE